MFLVEFLQIEKKGKKINQCVGFYDEDSSLDFGKKLIFCSNIEGVKISKVDTSYAEVIFNSCEVS